MVEKAHASQEAMVDAVRQLVELAGSLDNHIMIDRSLIDPMSRIQLRTSHLAASPVIYR